MKTLHEKIDTLKPGDMLTRTSPKYGKLYTAKVVEIERNQWGDLKAATLEVNGRRLRRTRSTLYDNFWI